MLPTRYLIIFVFILLSNGPYAGSMESLKEKKLGNETLSAIWRSNIVIDDIEAQIYINKIGAKLAKISSNTYTPFKFFITRDPSVNAFASWDGIIGVNTGLLIFTDDESELAGILAHEISHITQKHLNRFLDKNASQNIYLIGGILASVLVNNPEASKAILSSSIANNIQNQINFTREHEWEADRFASDILIKSDFNPIALATFFQKMISSSDKNEFLRTHPLNINRVSDNLSRLQKHKKHVQNSDSYNFIKAKIHIDLNKKIIDSDNQDVIDYSKAYEKYVNGSFSDSKKYIDKLIEHSKSGHVFILAGRIYSELGDSKFNNFFEYAKNIGFKEEAIYYQSKALKKSNKNNEAIMNLKLLLKTENGHALTHMLLANIYKDSNKTDRFQFQEAESLVKQGRFAPALMFYEQSKANTSDENLFQILTSKIRDLKQKINIYDQVD